MRSVSAPDGFQLEEDAPASNNLLTGSDIYRRRWRAQGEAEDVKRVVVESLTKQGFAFKGAWIHGPYPCETRLKGRRGGVGISVSVCDMSVNTYSPEPPGTIFVTYNLGDPDVV